MTFKDMIREDTGQRSPEKPSKPVGSKTRTDITEAIVRFMLDHGYPPTVREIGATTGLKSTSGVWFHLRKLEEQGVIELNDAKPRTIKVKGVRYIDERERHS